MSIETVRARWSAGEFKCHWFAVDPSSSDPSKQRQAMGHGPAFVLEAEQATSVHAPAPAAAPAAFDAQGMLGFATTLMQMADKRAETMLTAMAAMARGGGDGDAELRAQLAGLKAQLEADKREREIEQRHRDELAKKEAELAELRREKERLEDQADREEPVRLEPGTPILQQVGYGIGNALLAKPDILASLAGHLLPMLGGALPAPPATPPPEPAKLHGTHPGPRVPVVPSHAPAPAPRAPEKGPELRVVEKPAAPPPDAAKG